MENNTQKLINLAHKYSCHYNNGLSNHLPMALYSLDQINATEEQINSFYEGYVRKLEPIINSGFDIIDPTNHFGRTESFSSLIEYFDHQIELNGLKETINIIIPKLINGISGAAFHPLIRLAFAIEINNSKEVSHALASWVISYQELPSQDNQKPKMGLEQSLVSLKSLFDDTNYEIKGFGAFRRMLIVGQKDEFSNFLYSVNLEAYNLDKMADILIRLYLSSDDDFTALHTVTSCHALRVVSNLLDNKYLPELFKYYWQAIGAAYIVSGQNEVLRSFDHQDPPSWYAIKVAGCNSKDDHVIKLIYTCSEEYLYYKNPLYQLAAAKKVGLL